ncbi:hypothetical protein [Nocardioides terrisoli]|uniref:hypothetical protein n=1 Tax=Nocardioides terrisoli TaxID=3388267 RepID=UPI00287B72DB|nr:hypothetical protein [Nocardioides marmorisolisilvae]
MNIGDNAPSVYLDQVEEFADNFNGTPKQERNLSMFKDNYGRHVLGQMKSIYDHTADRVAKLEESLPEEAHVFTNEVRDRTDALETGRMDLDEFKRWLSNNAGPMLRRLREEHAAMVSAEDQAWTEVDMTPAEWQRAQARRSSALFKTGRALPRLTREVLDGTEFPEFH